jgi:hypothetical protein
MSKPITDNERKKENQWLCDVNINNQDVLCSQEWGGTVVVYRYECVPCGVRHHFQSGGQREREKERDFDLAFRRSSESVKETKPFVGRTNRIMLLQTVD